MDMLEVGRPDYSEERSRDTVIANCQFPFPAFGFFKSAIGNWQLAIKGESGF